MSDSKAILGSRLAWVLAYAKSGTTYRLSVNDDKNPLIRWRGPFPRHGSFGTGYTGVNGLIIPFRYVSDGDRLTVDLQEPTVGNTPQALLLEAPVLFEPSQRPLRAMGDLPEHEIQMSMYLAGGEAFGPSMPTPWVREYKPYEFLKTSVYVRWAARPWFIWTSEYGWHSPLILQVMATPSFPNQWDVCNPLEALYWGAESVR